MKTCIVLAGGLGTRLSHLIPDLPKCLAPVGPQPILKYILDHLIEQKIEKFIFSLGYRGSHVMDYLDEHFPNLDKFYVVEDQPLGTGGAIRKSIDHCTSLNVLVINADTYYPVELNRLYKFYEEKSPHLCICLKPIIQPDRYGTVDLDPDGKILMFKEKLIQTYGLINGGIYLINVDWFKQNFNESVFSFEKDVLEKYYPLSDFYGLVSDACFIDIGIPEDYNKAYQTIKEDKSQKWKLRNLFLDRDGVINVLAPNDYVKRWEEFKFRDEILKELFYLSKFFDRIFIVTNQQGIGKGLMSEEQLEEINEHFVSVFRQCGIEITKIYHCPHLKEEQCLCRKPKAGMLDQAKLEFPDLRFHESLIIGDSISDIQMGKLRGLITVALDENKNGMWDIVTPDIVISSIQEFRIKYLSQLNEGLFC